MATGKNGSDVLLKIGSKYISGQTSSSLDEAIDMIETTTKLSTARAKTFMSGEYGATMSVDCSYDPSDSTNTTYEEARAVLLAGEPVAFVIGGINVGDKFISGNCLFSGIGSSHPENDRVTFSVSIQVTGATATGTVTT